MNATIIDDEFADEFADEFGREITEALAPFRAADEEFVAGVQEKIERAGSHGEVRQMSDFARRAASLLPPFLLPLTLAKAVPAATGVVSKTTAWKFLPGLLALPAILIVALALVLFLAVCRIFSHSATQHRSRESLDGAIAWWHRNWQQLFVAFALLVPFTILIPLKIILAIFAASAVCLLAIYAALAHHGYATRTQVASVCAFFLMLLALTGLDSWLMLLAPLDPASSKGAGVLASIICGLGAVVCGAAAQPRGDVFGRKSVVGLGYILAHVALGITTQVSRADSSAIPQLQAVQTTRDEVIEYVETGPVEEARWSRLAGIIFHLQADGGSTPQLDQAIGRIRSKIAARRDANEAPHNTLSVSELEPLGFFSALDYQLYRDERSERLAKTQEGPLHFLEQRIFAALVTLETRGYTEAERQRLVDRLFASIPEPSSFRAVRGVELIARTLERLGHGERCDELRDPALAALSACWSGERGGDQACFGASADLIGRASLSPDHNLGFSWLGPTDWALRLMMRFGVPEGIDLNALHAYLAAEGRHFPQATIRDVNLHATAMRGALETWPAYVQTKSPPRSTAVVPPESLYRYRAPFGATVLALICVTLTWRSPRDAKKLAWRRNP